MLTDNSVLLRRHKELPALMCAQRKAEKRVSTEEDFIRANIDSFGNEIGQTTNYITSMFEVRSHFDPRSREYKVLSYRIRCGQLYQQNSIDKAKGIICKPMPKTWHDRHAIYKVEDETSRNFYRDIVADKKPYFMRYIYPALMKQYNTYIKNTNQNALREFQLTVDEMLAMPSEKLSERQLEFLTYYKQCMPVGIGDCIMNKICRRFEEEFDGHIKKHNEATKFDYRIMRNDAEYPASIFYSIKKVYAEYNHKLQTYKVFADYERMEKNEVSAELSVLNEQFRKECARICPDEKMLCNIILDICYTKNSTKKFAWSICSKEIINNLLMNNENRISFPTLNPDGDFEYGGERYSVVTKELEGET